MSVKAWSMMLCVSVIKMAVSAEWTVVYPNLLPTVDKHPESFSLDLGWSQDSNATRSNITLYLKKSQAVADRILYYTNDDNGKPSLTSLIDLKHTDFYQDLDSHASVSLTTFGGNAYSLRGSFLSNDESYEVEPYHPRVHKRSLGAEEGDHVIRKRSTDISDYTSDFIEPDPGSLDYNRVERARAEFEKMQRNVSLKKRSADSYISAEEMSSQSSNKIQQARLKLRKILREEKGRKRRNIRPPTMYTVELYIAVDYFLYLRLKESAERMDWPGGVDDYIAFFIGHQANEVDVRYRLLGSNRLSGDSSWTISTKLVYLNIAKTGSASPWTFDLYSNTSNKIDSSTALASWRHWVRTSYSPRGDHFMLLTGLSLTKENRSINGLAYLSSVCGYSPVSISELVSSTVYAHELGHNLGAYHDGDGNRCSEETQYVMRLSNRPPTSSTIGQQWSFSNCSVDYFTSFFRTLNWDFANCLLYEGAHIPISSSHLGQAIPVEEQCKLYHGKDVYYARSKFDTICSKLYCYYEGYANYLVRDAFEYTSCGNKKWCEKGFCVYHPDAPALDEKCPFEDKDFPEYNVNCSTMTASQCQASRFRQLYCCKACREFETPWLGPNCKYGDIGGLVCQTNDTDYKCHYYSEFCCESCCPILGPEEGYSCVQPPPTTTTFTIPTTKTTTSTTTTTTSTTKPKRGATPKTHSNNRSNTEAGQKEWKEIATFIGIAYGVMMVVVVAVVVLIKRKRRTKTKSNNRKKNNIYTMSYTNRF